jgi:hypothetical protein
MSRACVLLVRLAGENNAMQPFVHHAATRLLEIIFGQVMDDLERLGRAGLRQLLAALCLLVAHAPQLASTTTSATHAGINYSGEYIKSK